MADWAIGDIQGCYNELVSLCETIHFNPESDRLWVVGDLVNRGPDSLAVLRFIQGLGPAAKVVLGNHDLHLLAVYAGVSKTRRGDTLDAILTAPDAADLMAWLQQQPLLIQHENGRHVMTHAGIPPNWTIEQAANHARQVEAKLQSPKAIKLFKNMYGNKPSLWNDRLRGYKRLRYIINSFTRMRFCSKTGELCLGNKGTPQSGSSVSIKPWYKWRSKSETTCLITGHWSALGLRLKRRHIALDTGCVWGGTLTAVNLETEAVVQIPSQQRKAVFS